MKKLLHVAGQGIAAEVQHLEGRKADDRLERVVDWHGYSVITKSQGSELRQPGGHFLRVYERAGSAAFDVQPLGW